MAFGCQSSNCFRVSSGQDLHWRLFERWTFLVSIRSQIRHFMAHRSIVFKRCCAPGWCLSLSSITCILQRRLTSNWKESEALPLILQPNRFLFQYQPRMAAKQIRWVQARPELSILNSCSLNMNAESNWNIQHGWEGGERQFEAELCNCHQPIDKSMPFSIIKPNGVK